MDQIMYLYLLAITIGMCVAYFLITELFWLFFKNTFTSFSRRSIFSILSIICISLASYIVSELMLDGEWGNRVLHAFGGGFLTYFVCFLAVRDSQLSIDRFQFVVFSFLLVTSFGVFNEIIEFFIQKVLALPFSENPLDTWLDLISNFIGTLLAILALLPWTKKMIRDTK